MNGAIICCKFYLKSRIVRKHFFAEPAVVDVVTVVNVQMDLDLRLLVEGLPAGQTHRLGPLASDDREGQVASRNLVRRRRVRDLDMLVEVIDQDILEKFIS